MAEQLNELSKGTLKSYIKKASDNLHTNAHMAGAHGEHNSESDRKAAATTSNRAEKRNSGIRRATDKLEEEDQKGDLRFFYTIDGEDKGQYIDANSRSEAIQKVQQKTGKQPTNIKLASDEQPLSENINPFIVAAISDEGGEAKNILYTELSDRVLGALAERKQEIAGNLFVQPVQEEVEQIDELSKDTVSKYAAVAAHDKKKQEKDADYHRGQQAKHEKGHGPMDSHIASAHAKHADKAERRAGNREIGMAQAKKRLSPEAVHEEKSRPKFIVELSKTTLKSYIRKADSDIRGRKYQGIDKSAKEKDILKKRERGMDRAATKLDKLKK